MYFNELIHLNILILTYTNVRKYNEGHYLVYFYTASTCLRFSSQPRFTFWFNEFGLICVNEEN